MDAIQAVIGYAQDSDGFSSWGNEADDKYMKIVRTIRGMAVYRNRNTLNFQLEKMDDYINTLVYLVGSADLNL